MASWYGIEDKILALVFSLMILMNAVVVRSFSRSFFTPGALFSLFWFVFTFVPLLAVDAPINSMAVLHIFVATVAFSSSSYLFNWRGVILMSQSRASGKTFNTRLVMNALRFCSLSAILASIWVLLQNGINLNSIIFNLLATSGQFAADRGDTGQVYGLAGVISISLTYVSAVLGGILSTYPRKRLSRAMVVLLALMPSVFIMVSQSSKLVFLIAAGYFLGGKLYASFVLGEMRLFKAVSPKRAIIAALLLLPFIIFSFISREGYSDFSNYSVGMDRLLYAIRSYLFGQIYAFSDFFSDWVGMPSVSSFSHDSSAMGQYTFNGITSIMGFEKDILPRESGFQKYVFETNIFTIYRGLIHDFGIIGTYLVLMIMGLVWNYAFYGVIARRYSIFFGATYVSFVVFGAVSYLFSAFVAKYLILNIALVYFVLLLNGRIKTRRYRIRQNRLSESAPV
jgi:oligosaccharide repeat unit polymerase